MTICVFLEKEKCPRGVRVRRPKGKIGMELCPPSASELLEGKKGNAEETGKAYQTGFQITEVIPSVIDSPIATYRISVGSTREGNYKREETREMDREGAKESKMRGAGGKQRNRER